MITTATPTTDPNPLGALLARALAPSFANELPDPDDRLAYCTLLYTANTRWSLDRGTVHIATLPNGTLAGVLSLVPEPEPEWTPDLDHTYGYHHLAEWDKRLPDLDYTAIEQAAKAPLKTQTGPWIYINVLGVEPALQGNGIGTSLMHHAIANADRDHLPMGLMTDTERNVRFYTRLGFTTIAIPEPDAPLRLWTMLRPPATTT